MNQCHVAAVTNYMGASSFGSFAPVGEHLVDSCAGQSGRRYLAVEIGEACQLSCRHCIYHRPKSRRPFPNTEVLQVVGATVHETYRPLWITLAGKEATIYPKQLTWAARQVRAQGTTSILMTNGLLLNDDLIDALADLIDLFDISVDGTKAAHEWMRGAGTYEKTWDRIDAILRRTQGRVGLIATAVGGCAAGGQRQIDGVVELAHEIVQRCGAAGRVVLATSLYFGAPGDPMLLSPVDIVDLIVGLADSGCPSRVLLTANYAHQWTEIADRLGLGRAGLQYDASTGLPVVRFGSVNIIAFNLTQVPQVSARISNDGLVFLGCNHLTLGDAASRHAVADLAQEPLGQVLRELSDGTRTIFDQLNETSPVCRACPDYGQCQGGDRLSGIYFQRGAVDPFCPLISSPTADSAAALLRDQCAPKVVWIS